MSAIWLTLFHPDLHDSGPLLAVFRLTFASALAFSIVVAFSAIRRRDIARHQQSMIRAYALSLGAAHTDLHLGFGQPIFGDNETSTARLTGAAWVINLAIAEWVIRRRFNRRSPCAAAVVVPQRRGPAAPQSIRPTPPVSSPPSTGRVLPSDPGGIAGGQESDGAGDVFGLADASERIERAESIGAALLAVPVAGPDGGRGDGVHPDAVGGQTGREIEGQRADPGLRGRIRLAAEGGDPVHRADIDDRRTLGAPPQVRNGGPAAANDAEQVEVEHAGPHLIRLSPRTGRGRCHRQPR